MRLWGAGHKHHMGCGGLVSSGLGWVGATGPVLVALLCSPPTKQESTAGHGLCLGAGIWLCGADGCPGFACPWGEEMQDACLLMALCSVPSLLPCKKKLS